MYVQLFSLYAKICNPNFQNICKSMHLKICKNMQNICKIYAKICINPTSIDLIKKYAKICEKYAKICKLCRHEIYMQNMQKSALPTLLMEAPIIPIIRLINPNYFLSYPQQVCPFLVVVRIHFTI